MLGGTFTTIKTVGKRVDDMVVRDDVFKRLAFDMKLESLIPVLKGKIPLKVRACGDFRQSSFFGDWKGNLIVKNAIGRDIKRMHFF